MILLQSRSFKPSIQRTQMIVDIITNHSDNRHAIIPSQYSILFKRRTMSRQIREYFDTCPTQRTLPIMKRGILAFESHTCRYATYSSRAMELQQLFDGWRENQRLCLNCKNFLAAKQQNVCVLLQNLLSLPVLENRSLIQGNGIMLMAIFEKMDLQRICVNSPRPLVLQPPRPLIISALQQPGVSPAIQRPQNEAKEEAEVKQQAQLIQQQPSESDHHPLAKEKTEQ